MIDDKRDEVAEARWLTTLTQQKPAKSESLPEYVLVIGIYKSIDEINRLAAQGYELVGTSSCTDDDDRVDAVFVMRLRSATDDITDQAQAERANIIRCDLTSLAGAVANLGDRLDTVLADLGRAGTGHEMQLRHIRAHDGYQAVLDNINARLDGLPEQLGKSERVLLDRIEALEKRCADIEKATARLIIDCAPSLEAKIEALEARLPVDPGTRTVTCPACKGIGTTTYSTNQEQYIAISCQVCRGTGRVPA